MVQHTPAARKVLKAQTDQYQVIKGGGAAPYLADAETLMKTDGMSLLATLAIERGAHT